MIDLRSDTVTQPSVEMREIMMKAEVGDDVFGDDPSVNELESFAADYLGKGAAMFVASGTQANLCALLSHCQRGDEYIVGQQAHTYRYEGGGAAVLGSIQPQPLEHSSDGSLDIARIQSAIKPDDSHFAKTKLICLENTIGGKVIPQSYILRVGELAKEKGLSFHLDGARVMNAAISQEISVKKIVESFDSVSLCLSKGLGAPVGALLIGSPEFIETARRWRKMLGGGMRQAGILAAAGLYALQNNVKGLLEDHRRAQQLYTGLSKISELEVIGCETNMVFLKIEERRVQSLSSFLKDRDILIYTRGSSLRLVTHLDIFDDDISFIIRAFNEYFEKLK